MRCLKRGLRSAFLGMVGFSFVLPVHALYTSEMPEKLQTTVQEPRERRISLKLPLEQPMFHWVFSSREGFLAGRLVLRIKRNDELNEIVIFENGKLSKGWAPMPFPSKAAKTGIYFGFLSSRAYATAPGDKLELELTVVKDLPGIGALQAGTLPAGTYRSKGAYSGLIDEYDATEMLKGLEQVGKVDARGREEVVAKVREMYEHKAFLQSWKPQWPLTITADQGWLPPEQAATTKAMMQKVKAEQKNAP